VRDEEVIAAADAAGLAMAFTGASLIFSESQCRD
jgi:AICAR transformylase/IMP cyclohydrolase PurH